MGKQKQTKKSVSKAPEVAHAEDTTTQVPEETHNEPTHAQEPAPATEATSAVTSVEHPAASHQVAHTHQPEASTTTIVAKPQEHSEPNRIVEYAELNEYHKMIYPWQQHIAPGFSKNYFYNPFTGESVWELPEEVQAKATAFFERVRENDLDRKDVNMERFMTDLDTKRVEAKKVTELDYMKRPARKQVETPISQRFAYRQGDEIYNIWYDKFLSDDKFKEREQAPTKINPEEDIGYTKADVYEKNQSYFCMHFSRGCCVEGTNCRYYHHIPTLEECMAIDQIRDVFGRTRYAKQRDDMEGVGSFLSETRTLKATDFCLIKGADEVALTYECLWRHYGTLGELEDIHLIPERCIAFIRYKHRCMAEFAKEAMANQALESNEIMIVRWSDTDIFGQDPTQVENQGIAPTNLDERKPKNGRLRKQKREKVETVDETAIELNRLNQEEEMLAKRQDAEKEYGIVNLRIEQIQKNVNLMGNVLKKIKTSENDENSRKLNLDFDSFAKSYKPSGDSASSSAFNDMPLF